MYRTIEIKEDDYRYLEKSARLAGTTIPSLLRELIGKKKAADESAFAKTSVSDRTCGEKGRWAKFSEKICENPPLRGAGDYVRECSEKFREDFTFRHDEE
ncbi:hypothetical protein [Desulfonema magnum]|uniref:Uncharacterized protein n=1 Tax=Desulfonema magnum TaxID=45655 RepID=A0A975BWL0_9BACT|nr:hypothetical protein [Desulfonema magnum]QTA92993.1 Uncharacterized protein dnm_090860 [Desulfonema magnum]